MTNFQSVQLDKAIRRRLRLSEAGSNPKPTLRSNDLADEFDTTVDYVRARIAELNSNAPRLEGEAEGGT
jgi:hypothetical protein